MRPCQRLVGSPEAAKGDFRLGARKGPELAPDSLSLLALFRAIGERFSGTPACVDASRGRNSHTVVQANPNRRVIKVIASDISTGRSVGSR